MCMSVSGWNPTNRGYCFYAQKSSRSAHGRGSGANTLGVRSGLHRLILTVRTSEYVHCGGAALGAIGAGSLALPNLVSPFTLGSQSRLDFLLSLARDPKCHCRPSRLPARNDAAVAKPQPGPRQASVRGTNRAFRTQAPRSRCSGSRCRLRRPSATYLDLRVVARALDTTVPAPVVVAAAAIFADRKCGREIAAPLRAEGCLKREVSDGRGWSCGQGSSVGLAGISI